MCLYCHVRNLRPLLLILEVGGSGYLGSRCVQRNAESVAGDVDVNEDEKTTKARREETEHGTRREKLQPLKRRTQEELRENRTREKNTLKAYWSRRRPRSLRYRRERLSERKQDRAAMVSGAQRLRAGQGGWWVVSTARGQTRARSRAVLVRSGWVRTRLLARGGWAMPQYTIFSQTEFIL